MRADRQPACDGTSPPLLLNRLPSSRASDYDAIVTYSELPGRAEDFRWRLTR